MSALWRRVETELDLTGAFSIKKFSFLLTFLIITVSLQSWGIGNYINYSTNISL